MMVVRQLISIAALPGTVAVAVPLFIARRASIAFEEPRDAIAIALVVGGILALVVVGGILALVLGVVLFSASLFYFWSRGRGTLAPWDPPRRFVVQGPYRYVRNPMISGVLFALVGEALVLRSWPHAEWAGMFAVINMVYIPVVEEPMLASRFGEPYARYRRAVPRFLPRLHPWTP